MRPTLRLLFAVLGIIGGAYLAIKSGGDTWRLIAGLTMISVAVATVAP